MPRGVCKDPAGKKLTEAQQRFHDVFTDPGARGNNAVTAYIEAGYAATNPDGTPAKWLRQRAYGVLHTPRMQAQIVRTRAARLASQDARDALVVDTIRHEHWKLYERAWELGNLSECRQNMEALGRTIAAYVDRQELDVGRREEMTQYQLEEASRLATLMLRGDGVRQVTRGPAGLVEGAEEHTEPLPHPVPSWDFRAGQQGPAVVIEGSLGSSAPRPESIQLSTPTGQEPAQCPAQTEASREGQEPAPSHEQPPSNVPTVQQQPQEQRPSVQEQAKDIPEELPGETPLHPQGGRDPQ